MVRTVGGRGAAGGSVVGGNGLEQDAEKRRCGAEAVIAAGCLSARCGSVVMMAAAVVMTLIVVVVTLNVLAGGVKRIGSKGV